jgi:uncharacterized protein
LIKQSVRIYFFLFFALMFASILRGQPQVPNRPSPPRLVNDLAGLLPLDEVNALERTLVAYDDSTSSQVAIVILKELGDYAIEDWALEIGRKWGVGRKAKNNGVVIIVSMSPKKINISPGYGLEGALPDILCKRIISNEISPSFKTGQYAEGLTKGVKAIRGAVKGEYVNQDHSQGSGDSSDAFFWVFIIFMGIILVFVLISANARRSGGTYYSPHRRRNYDNGGGWIIFGGGGDSNWGGGGNNNDDGGSFGGFGGGDFGGGGASGDW